MQALLPAAAAAAPNSQDTKYHIHGLRAFLETFDLPRQWYPKTNNNQSNWQFKPESTLSTYLPNIRQKKESQRSTEDTQRTRHKKRILTRTHLIRSVVLNNRENVGAHKGPDFPTRRRNTVVLAADRSGAGFGGAQSAVIAWS